MRVTPSPAGRGLEKAHAAPVETFGVELHTERAEEAKHRLDRVLGTDLFATSIANGAFGLLYLNPPYDWDSGEEKRVEHAFLTHCTRYLAEDGLLVFVVPRQRLAVSARYLASHFSRIDCWAFPEPEREAYDQVVLLGYRKAEVFLDAHAEERIHQWAAGEAPELGPRRYPLYVATATPAGDVLFATRTIDPVAAAEEARSSGLWASTAVMDLLWPAQGPAHASTHASAARPPGHARGGGLPRQPPAGGRGQPHPRQGPHLQGDGPGRAHAHEGGPSASACAPPSSPSTWTPARSPTSPA